MGDPVTTPAATVPPGWPQRLWRSTHPVLEGCSSYGRTVGLLFPRGPGQTLALLALALAAGVVPLATFIVTEHLVNAITAAIGRADWWHVVILWLLALVCLQVAPRGRWGRCSSRSRATSWRTSRCG